MALSFSLSLWAFFAKIPCFLCERIRLVARFLALFCRRILEHEGCAHEVRTSGSLLAMDPFFPDFLRSVMCLCLLCSLLFLPRGRRGISSRSRHISYHLIPKTASTYHVSHHTNSKRSRQGRHAQTPETAFSTEPNF